MDLAVMLGAVFLSLANGMNDEQRARALNMLSYFAERDTFSPAERHIIRTMTNMAADVFNEPAKPIKQPPKPAHLKLVTA
jgi:Ser/Thr protein kinase RdoA (MazF antagonist)